MNTVTVSLKMHHISVYAILDSGAGCSVIDLGFLEKLGLAQNITSSNHRLINASGKTMDILGTVNMEVKFNRMKPIVHEFKVLNTRTYNNILIGRDLIKMFGTVKFDFTKNRVQLGNV